ncbi:hypothetical protein BLA29_007918 [Euroglyphus maynei]|uniref:Uncharacterized protein n=1 Tax=Euroglyphus maynei TaxID=6958 RepID=A0A1Y3BJS3_EURMA|nr:hypothetical protein BLA29_007918 [Euroglyphus maynei]
MLDLIKKHLQSMMPSDYWIQLVDKYWNNFAQIIVTAPIIWFHFTSIMAHTDWNHYNCIYKCLFIFYLFLVFAVHELLRLIVVKILNKELTVSELLNAVKQFLMTAKQFLMESSLLNESLLDKCKRIRSNANKMIQSKTAIISDKQK